MQLLHREIWRRVPCTLFFHFLSGVRILKFINSVRSAISTIIVYLMVIYGVVAAVPGFIMFLIAALIAPRAKNEITAARLKNAARIVNKMKDELK